MMSNPLQKRRTQLYIKIQRPEKIVLNTSGMGKAYVVIAEKLYLIDKRE